MVGNIEEDERMDVAILFLFPCVVDKIVLLCEVEAFLAEMRRDYGVWLNFLEDLGHFFCFLVSLFAF